MDSTKEIGVVRSVLRSELTWVVFIVVGIWGFVTSVVLPLQDLRQQLAHLQSDITHEIVSLQSLDARVKILEIEHAKLGR